MRNANLWIVRSAYAKNAGKSVRCIKDESITAELPVLNTAPVTDTTSTTAVCGRNVTDDSGAPVIARGVVWSTNPGTTIEINEGITHDGAGLGEFTSTLIGLTPETTYYVRAYAMNSAGTAYGDELVFNTNNTFVCGTSTVSDYDGNNYYTMEIGYQCWMTENLKTTHYNNGSPIDYPGFDNAAWVNNTTGAYAWLQNLPYWKDIYGALYNWHAVNNDNGLCPEGWKVPSDTEFADLTDYLGGLSVAGGKMKSVRTAPDPHPRWESPNTSATNESSWSGVPGGKRSISFDFSGLGYSGYWWTSTEASTSTAYWLGLSFDHKDVSMSIWGSGKTEGLSVRCIKDY